MPMTYRRFPNLPLAYCLGFGSLCVALNLLWTPYNAVARGSEGSQSHERIKRSAAAKNQFKRQHPCPSTGKSKGACPGYVIDHVVPLKRGGKDAPDNMQWQTKEAAKLKDRTE